MSLKIGIVGLPNVGKSTLFNALTRTAQAQAENFPFCTIDPNIGIVEVPDERLDKLAEIVNPQKLIPSTVEFVDIAGLVKGASEGEGLGNKFLSHIRECDAIAHVVRAFEDDNIHHVSGSIDAGRDLEIIMTELVLADLESITRQRDKLAGKARSGDKEAKLDLALAETVETILKEGKLLCEYDWKEDDLPRLKRFQLLTAKPYLIVANTSEDNFASFNEDLFREEVRVTDSHIPVVPISARVEAELVDLSYEEAQAFLAELGADKSGLDRLIEVGFRLLGLQSYFTAGVKEVRAWTIRTGMTAPQAAGVIHTDFERGFICAEVIAYDDFVSYGGEHGAKEKGKARTEGKSYIVQDGDVMHFRFNV